MKENITKALKQVNYKLYSTLLLFGSFPVVYTTVRIYFLGDLPNDWGDNIASQLSWINIIYEVIQEFILLPIFFLLGKSLSNKSELENKIKTSFLFTFLIYTAISIMLIIFAKPLLIFMRQKDELLIKSITYIRLESIASVFKILVQLLILILITIKKDKYLLSVLLIQMILSIVLDSFLVSSLPISLKLGVNGIAYSNIIVNLILLIVIIIYLRTENYNIFSKRKLDISWMKEWFIIGGYSGIESFVRNLAFVIMVLKMVNIVGEQGTFWIANNFIWGWLLLPVIQLGQLVKRDCGEYGRKAISDKSHGYFLLTSIIVTIWLLSIPIWQPFIKYVMNVTEYVKVFNIALISLGFYVLFAFNNIIDSIFYGIGKTNYMLFQSIIINTFFYGILFILYKQGIYKPTLNKIALMFAAGIGFDALLTFGMFIWMLRKRKIRLSW